MANGWRYFAQRLTGNPANDEIFNLDLPLQDVKIVDVLSGPTRLSAKIDPVVAQLLAPDGRPLLGKWKTAIYAEHESGEVFGTILDDPQLQGSQLSLNCIGFAGYPDGQPYTESWSGVEVDPLDVVREAWDHLQRQYNGNLGVEVDDVTFTPIRLGIKKTLRKLDPKDDPNVGPSFFESGPARLAWYETDDIGAYINQLASDTPFDYHERHEWDGEQIRHHLDFYYPRKGNRRTDLRFVVGENIAVIPTVDTDEYATEVLALGAGEGRAMLRATQSRPWDGLRRATTVIDKSCRSKASINSLARRELAWRVGLDDIAEIVVRDHPHAPLNGTADRPPARVGDEIFIQGYTGWEGVGHWCRILEREIAPESGDTMKFTVMRSDKLGDPHPLLTPISVAAPVAPAPVGFPFESPGWRYLQVSASDTVNRSAASFNDSTWQVGAAPFADKTPIAHGGWPNPATTWQANTAIWLRRTVTAAVGAQVTLTLRADNWMEVFWNGVLIRPSSAGAGGLVLDEVLVVPANLVQATNTLAVHAIDDSNSNASVSDTYADVSCAIAGA